MNVFNIRGQERIFDVFGIDDPLSSQVEDPRELTLFFNKTGIIPYASRNKGTGDAQRAFFARLAKSSPTHAGCIKSKCDMSFNGNIKLHRHNYFMGGSEVTESEIEQYSEEFYKNIRFQGTQNYNKFLWEIGRSYESVGECFLKCKWYKVNGEWKVTIQRMPHKYSYVKFNQNGDLYYVYLPNIYAMKIEEGESYPFWPFVKEEKTGITTVLHIKNGLGYYGEPDSIDSVVEQYSELQLALYNLNMSKNNFVGQLFIEYEGEATNKGVVNEDQAKSHGYSSLAAQFMHNTTLGGKQQTAIITKRPQGSRPAVVVQLRPNTNQGYFSQMKENNSDYIVISHRWSHKLLGEKVPSGLGSGAYIEEYMVKMETVIPSVKFSILEPLDQIIGFTNELNEKNNLVGIGQDIVNPWYVKIMELQSKNSNEIKKVE